MQEDVEDLKRLQHLLQQEADTQSLLARVQQSASLTTEQAGIVVDALAPKANHGQPGQAARSLAATLQRLVAASCKLQTVAFVAFELSRKTQQHGGGGSAEVVSHDTVPPDMASDAAGTNALQASSKAVAEVAERALAALNTSKAIGTQASSASEPRTLNSDGRFGPVQALLSCLECSTDGKQPSVPWTQEAFDDALRTARDQMWSQLADAVMAVAATGSASRTVDPATLELLDAFASVAPVRSSSAPTR